MVYILGSIFWDHVWGWFFESDVFGVICTLFKAISPQQSLNWSTFNSFFFLIFLLLIMKGRLIRIINNASHSMWYCTVLYRVIPSNFDRCRCGMLSLFKAVLFLIILVQFQKTWILFREKIWLYLFALRIWEQKSCELTMVTTAFGHLLV